MLFYIGELEVSDNCLEVDFFFIDELIENGDCFLKVIYCEFIVMDENGNEIICD